MSQRRRQCHGGVQDSKNGDLWAEVWIRKRPCLLPIASAQPSKTQSYCPLLPLEVNSPGRLIRLPETRGDTGRRARGHWGSWDRGGRFISFYFLQTNQDHVQAFRLHAYGRYVPRAPHIHKASSANESPGAKTLGNCAVLYRTNERPRAIFALSRLTNN